MHIKRDKYLGQINTRTYICLTTARFLETKRMQGEAEVPQKMEATPESIRDENMYAQACIGTKPDAFVFYTQPSIRFGHKAFTA